MTVTSSESKVENQARHSSSHVEQEESSGQYRLQRVNGQTAATVFDEIVDFWRRNQALPPGDDGQQRSRQVFFVARNPAAEVVGVCSVYVADFLKAGDPHYFYRTFVRPEDRNYFLMVRMWQRSGECLRSEYTPGKPRGLVIVAENPLFQHPKVQLRMQRGGYRLVGKDGRGCDVWYLALAPNS